MNLRIDSDSDIRIRRAAQAAGVSVSGFVASAAAAAAEEVLADRREFVLQREQWDEFVRMLDAPARDLPRLREAARLRDRLLAEQ